MRGAVMYGPGDVRVEERAEATILAPTDAILRLPATCICGSDLWPWRGVDDYGRPAPMGHGDAGIVEEVGGEVRMILPGHAHRVRRDRHRRGARDDGVARVKTSRAGSTRIVTLSRRGPEGCTRAARPPDPDAA